MEEITPADRRIFRVNYNRVVDDAVDRVLEQWARERPDLDTSPMAVLGRLVRLAHDVDRELQRVFARFGLGRGEFDVLASLRRGGEPHRLSPGALIQSMMVTSGAVTKRVDRLERAGLVTRTPDPTDRRGVLVGLTPAGLELVERVVEEHVANEERLLAGLGDREREQLARLLRKLGASIDAAKRHEEPGP